MTTERMLPIFYNSRIRNAVTEIAAAFTRDPGVQDTLIAKAWIAIGEQTGDKTTEYYIGVAYAVMRDVWERYYMPDGDGRRANHASIQRANRLLRKYHDTR